MDGSLKYRASEHLVFDATLLHYFVILIAFAISLLLCSTRKRHSHSKELLISVSERPQSSSGSSGYKGRCYDENGQSSAKRTSSRELPGDPDHRTAGASSSVRDTDGTDGASDHPKPRVFPMTEKQVRIEEEHEMRDPSEYPTMEDIASDWDSDTTELNSMEKDITAVPEKQKAAESQKQKPAGFQKQKPAGFQKQKPAGFQKQKPAGFQKEKSAAKPELKEDTTLTSSSDKFASVGRDGRIDTSDRGDDVDEDHSASNSVSFFAAWPTVAAL